MSAPGHDSAPEPARTALVVVDPYNDFLSVGGKGWLLNRATLSKFDTNANLGRLLTHARAKQMPVCFAPHARYRRGLFDQRRFLNPSLYLARLFRTFAVNRWGGRFRNGLGPLADEFVASEHLVSSAFVGTDLDQHLTAAGVQEMVLCGCLSNTCIESTARSAVELGYRVTIIADALAAMSPCDHDAAIESGFPMCAHRVMSTAEWIGAMQQ